MTQRSWIALAVFGVAACSSGAAAPSPAPSDSTSEGIPREMAVVFEAPYHDEAYDDPDLPGARFLRERFTLVGSDGMSIGEGELSAIDYRVGDTSVTCGEDSFSGVDGHDLADPPGEMTATIDDGTTLLLRPSRQIVAYESNGGFPICFEQTGTYRATFPPGSSPALQEGTYRMVDNSLELD